MLFCSISAFGLDYISYQDTDANFIIDGSVFYSNWIAFSLWGGGVTGEMKLFNNFFIGGDVTYGHFSIPSITLDFSTMSVAAYAKYILFDYEKTKEIIGMPFSLALIGGVDTMYSFVDLKAYSDYDFFSMAETGFETSGAVIVSYKIKFFGKDAIISAYIDFGLRFYNEYVNISGDNYETSNVMKPTYGYGFDLYVPTTENSFFFNILCSINRNWSFISNYFIK